ncbi:MAG: mechanosensitive ion channel [Anaerolineales bacterium]|nr:mechanosensitive ion channel [Anaerolineales bacterium]
MEPLKNVLNILQVYLGRFEVQIQLIAICTILVATLLVGFLLWKLLWQPVQTLLRKRFNGALGSAFSFLISVCQAVTFPVLGLIGLQYAQNQFATFGWIDGLLAKFTLVLWIFMLFQVFIVILYNFIDPRIVRRYHYRLFIPLLLVMLLLELLSDLTDLRMVSGVVLTTAFNSPVTVGAIFLATIGLYFWTDTLHGLDDLIFNLSIRYTRLDPGGTKAVLTLGRYALIILGILFVINVLNLDATTVAAITGGLAVGVGFGLREVLSNFVSGIYLLFERSLHPGDVIEMDGQLSVVDNLSIRSTTLRTLNNVELVIPNQSFFTSPFKTFTGSDKQVRVPIMLNTDCNIEPTYVMQLMRKTAVQHKAVLNDPAPSVFLLEYGNNVASFQLNVWLDNPVLIPKTQSDIKVMLWNALAEHNIDLPFPEMELHFPKRVPLDVITTEKNKKPLWPVNAREAAHKVSSANSGNGYSV